MIITIYALTGKHKNVLEKKVEICHDDCLADLIANKWAEEGFHVVVETEE